MKMTFARKIAVALSLGLAAAGGIAATPAMARGQHDYRPGDYYRGYERGGYYGADRGYRDYRRYDRYDRYDRDDYRRYRGYRSNHYRYNCRDNGTGGAIIGAIAGGLLGNEVAGRGDRTTGAVVGAAVGAVAGHAIDKGNGRC